MDVQVAVVSLPDAIERRAFVTRNLALPGGLAWSFFDALRHDAAVPGLDCDVAEQKGQYGRALTNGEIGCFKSHYALLSAFVRDGAREWLLVLEDDVWLDQNFNIFEVIAYCDARHIKYIRLFAKMYKAAKVVDIISDFRQIIRFKSDPYGTQAYLIHRDGARALLANTRTIAVPFDDEIGKFWEHKLDAYSVFPFPAVERCVPSALTANRDASSAGRSHRSPRRLLNRTRHKMQKWLYNTRFALNAS